MKAKNLFKTLAAVGYGLAMVTQSANRDPRTDVVTPTPLDINTRNLEVELGQLTQQVRRQNNFWNRFVLGLATGAGTAIGASVIATIVILILGPLLKAVGIDIDFPPRA